MTFSLTTTLFFHVKLTELRFVLRYK